MHAKKKYRIYQRCNCKCHYCGDDIIKIINDGYYPTLDHLIPRINGGDNSELNMVLSCSFCNFSKGIKNESEMKMYIQPYIDGLCEKKDLKNYHS